MKVMAVAPSLARAGAERVVSLLSLEWSKSCEVVVVLFDGSDPAYEWGGRLVDLQLAGRTRIGTRARVALRGVGRLARLLRLEQPDRIVSFMEPANFPSAIGAAVAGMSQRLTVSVHHDPTKLPWFRRALIPWIYRLPFRVVAVSEGVRSALESMGVPAGKLSTIHNPVARRAEVDPTGPPFPGRYILGAGRLRGEKGFDRLLRAFAGLTVADVHLVILGEGSERGKLIELSHELGLGERVHLPGVVSDIESWYRHAECFVLSSRTEAWAMVLVEAMAHGCPVVSFRCDYGPAEIIDDGRNGILVTEGDVGALATAVARVIEDGTLRRRFVTAGRERAAGFDVTEIAPRWIGD